MSKIYLLNPFTILRKWIYSSAPLNGGGFEEAHATDNRAHGAHDWFSH